MKRILSIVIIIICILNMVFISSQSSEIEKIKKPIENEEESTEEESVEEVIIVDMIGGKSSLEKVLEKEKLDINTETEYRYEYQIYYECLWHHEFVGRPDIDGLNTLYDPASYENPMIVDMGFSTLPVDYLKVYKNKEYQGVKEKKGEDMYDEEVRRMKEECNYYDVQAAVSMFAKNDQMYICLEELLEMMEIELISSDDKRNVTFRYRDVLVTYEVGNQQIILNTERGRGIYMPDELNYQMWIMTFKGGNGHRGFRMIKNNEVVPNKLVIPEKDLEKIYPEYKDGKLYVPISMLIFLRKPYLSRPTDNTLYIDNTDQLGLLEKSNELLINDGQTHLIIE